LYKNIDIRKDDVIIDIDHLEITNFGQFIAYLLQKKKAGDMLKLTLWRKGKIFEIDYPMIGEKLDLGFISDPKFVGKGVKIAFIFTSSAAIEGGLKVGDIILSIDKKEIKHRKDIEKLKSTLKKDVSLNFVVLRDEKKIHLKIKPHWVTQ
jgi:S1-C subfamily serine protease